MKEYVSHSENETAAIAADIALMLRGGDVVAFFGGMGMGKTVFVRSAVRSLNIDADVSSPTFAIVNDYGGSPHVYHFDMYRVESWDSLYSTGFFDYMNDNSILFIEWSENIENVLPDNTVYIEFGLGATEDDRLIKVSGGDGRW